MQKTRGPFLHLLWSSGVLVKEWFPSVRCRDTRNVNLYIKIGVRGRLCSSKDPCREKERIVLLIASFPYHGRRSQDQEDPGSILTVKERV
jgi:hypothetical protein